jgi:pyruvate,water dikinase
VVKKDLLEIIDKTVNVQEQALVRSKDGGSIWEKVPKEKAESQVLKDEEILQLSKLIIKIESHYKFPVDIEWARERGDFFILQSRPITTL